MALSFSSGPKILTSEGTKTPSQDGRVQIDPDVPNVVSFSGADFLFLLHVPVLPGNAKFNFYIKELRDEILELEAQVRKYDNQQKDPSLNQLGPLRQGVFDLSFQAKAKIEFLQKEINKLENNKSDVIPINLNTLQTLSFQMHVDKQPVRALGHSYPKGYTRGAVLIAGSMIFTVIREHPLMKVIDMINSGGALDKLIPGLNYSQPSTGADMFPATATANNLPPLHLTILGVNEAGNAMNMTLFGLEFLNDGMVLSIQDMITENTINFVAQDIDIMRSLDTRGIEKIPAVSRAVTASSFLSGPLAAARRARRGLPF